MFHFYSVIHSFLYTLISVYWKEKKIMKDFFCWSRKKISANRSRPRTNERIKLIRIGVNNFAVAVAAYSIVVAVFNLWKKVLLAGWLASIYLRNVFSVVCFFLFSHFSLFAPFFSFDDLQWTLLVMYVFVYTYTTHVYYVFFFLSLFFSLLPRWLTTRQFEQQILFYEHFISPYAIYLECVQFLVSFMHFMTHSFTVSISVTRARAHTHTQKLLMPWFTCPSWKKILFFLVKIIIIFFFRKLKPWMG